MVRTAAAPAPLLAVCLALAACGGSEPAASPAAPDGPNVLVIVTDDQGDGRMRFMPETKEELGGKGLTFANAYVTTPLCCPSRGSIFSGQYTHNHGIIGNSVGHAAVRDYDVEASWPEELREAGYRTGLSGKFLNHWPRERRPAMFDFYSWPDGGEADDKGKRIDALRAKRAREFVSESEADDERPWALTLALHAPHTPYDPPPRFARLDTGRFPQNPATRERDLSDKAALVSELQASDRTVQESWEGQGRTLRATDELIADLLRMLEQEGERENTLIIFTSDNGYMTGEHGLSKKVWPYPASIGVPLIVSWPGHVQGPETSRDLVANIDIAPTVLEAAGVEPDYTLDGRSLISGPPREWLFLEGPRQGEKSEYEPWDAYIDEDTHMIQWRDADGWRELYDLDADPHELESVLADGDAANDADGDPFLEKIEAARDCAGSSCP